MKNKIIITLLCLLLSACAGTAPKISIPTTPPKSLQLSSPPRVALVLGGGGARGYAHAGVLTVLQRNHIPIDLIVGTSAGSIWGALYADQANAAQVDRETLAAGFWDFADIENYPSAGGIMQGYHLQKFLLNHMQAREFNQLKIPLIAVSTDLKTGAVFPISSGPIAPAVEASAAIPGLIKPVHLYGHTLVDGGMSDPIAVNIAKTYHPKIIIAVNISRQLSPKIPTSAKKIELRAMLIRAWHFSKLSEQGADVIIRPQVGDRSVFDIGDKQALFKAGEIAAEKALPQIKQLLKEKGIGDGD